MSERRYNVIMVAYCGMRYDIATNVSHDEAKAAAKRFRDKMKAHGCGVTYLGGCEWEIQTPDDAGSISDNEGFLKIKAVKREKSC